jgi:hypothetical protein
VELPDKPYIVLRPSPYFASYCDDVGSFDCLLKKAKKQIFIVPRSEADFRYEAYPNVEVIKSPVDMLFFMKHADLVVTGGGTMAREAALLGVPAISFFDRPLAVDRYLMDKGLMTHVDNLSKCDLERCKKTNVNLKSFEDPVDIIKEVIKDDI